MAIRKREGRAKPWQVYWNNPFTGKRETISFETKEEAEKEDSLVKHRLKFERESFKNEQSEEKQKYLTLEAAYILYLKEKQFSKKGLAWQMDSMRMPLGRFGSKELTQISKEDLQAYQDDYAKRNVKAVTVRNRMAVLRQCCVGQPRKAFVRCHKCQNRQRASSRNSSPLRGKKCWPCWKLRRRILRG